MKMKVYKEFYNGLIDNGLKFEVGKRYKILNKLSFFKFKIDLLIYNQLDFRNITFCEVEIDENKTEENVEGFYKTNEFKILRTLNVSEFPLRRDYMDNLNDDNVLLIYNLYKNNKNIDIRSIIKKRNYKNDDFLTKTIIRVCKDDDLELLDKDINDDKLNVVLYLKKPNKYIDRLLSSPEHNKKIRIHLSKFKDLDELVYDIDSKIRVLVAKTGIDKFLDEYMDYIDIPILMEISKVGRKKDLDIFVNSPLEEIRSIVASHGYDEHLDMLVNDESKMVLQSVLDIGRDKDIDILRKSTYAKELNFPKK